MGISDGNKASSSKKSKFLIGFKSGSTASKNEPMEKVIPQMVVTSVEGECEDIIVDNDPLLGQENTSDPNSSQKAAEMSESFSSPTNQPVQRENVNIESTIQAASQRPLIIETKDDSNIPIPNGSHQDVTTESAHQRPLVINSETINSHDAHSSSRPESIYEPIEAIRRIPDDTEKSKVSKSSQERIKESKETESFFKPFWKQDSKPLFSFPKFGFGSKSVKKEEKIKTQEYSIEAAEAMQDHIIEQFKRLDEDSTMVKMSDSGTKVKFKESSEDPQKPNDQTSSSMPECSQKGRAKIAEVDEFDLNLNDYRPTKSTDQRPSTPESLYASCCIKLSAMLHNKAFALTHGSYRPAPPKKPPKPSAEALAKARADMATKRLREYESRPLHFGDSMPVGINGIRYADDDTESSTDYKDLENCGFVMNPECYGIIRKSKAEENEGFRAPSTCSGMSSYYTADTATLKDENSSDNTLETISLGSYDSIICRTSSLDRKGELPNSDQSASTPFKSLPTTIHQTPKKSAPPIPPKPIILPKQNQTSPSPKFSSSDIKTSIRALSLSPRPIMRNTARSEGIKKRPLTIAGIKATEFESEFSRNTTLHSSIKKPVLHTVVKNNSLKTMRNLPVDSFSQVKSLTSSKSESSHDSSQKTNAKPTPPPRPPPPPAKPEMTKPESQISPPPIAPEIVRPPRKSTHTTSPTRPAPPTVKPAIIHPKPPPRPPPPAVHLAATSNPQSDSSIPLSDNITHTEVKESGSIQIDAVIDEESTNKMDLTCITHSSTVEKVEVPMKESFQKPEESESLQESIIDNSEAVRFPENKNESVDGSDNYIVPLPITESSSQAIIDVSFGTISPPARRAKPPRPPPRIRRCRSRTVEVVPVVDKVTDVRRRSQSLSDIDRERLRSSLAVDKPDLKALYTTVNKDPSRMKNKFVDNGNSKLSSSSETISARPLPPPPPPPRMKSRSASCRSKSDERPSTAASLCSSEFSILAKAESLPDEINGHSLKAPARKKKTKRQQFFSLHRDPEKSEFAGEKKFHSLRFSNEINFTPLKPERRLKHPPVNLDENANITEPVNEIPSKLENNNGSFDKIPPKPPSRPRVKSMGPEKTTFDGAIGRPVRRSKSEIEKSHSQWYDDDFDDSDKPPNDGKRIIKKDSTDSWEKLDWSIDDNVDHGVIPIPPKSKKSQQTSTFYVNVDEEERSISSCTNREDKETSPFRLECSEKSVQTSLETLSAIPASRGELSEDTDDLLDLAQTLQDELKTIIKRHKASDALKSSDDSCSTSEGSLTRRRSSGKKKSEILTHMQRPPLESTTSSASELWQISSSEESDDDGQQGVANLSEISRNKKNKKIFYIAQEIVSSEEAFVDSLKLLNVHFRSFIGYTNNQRGVQIVPEEVLNQILNHLPQLQHLNENLLMELKYRIDQWAVVGKIADVIVKMGPFLKLYSWYIQDFETTTSVLEEAKKKYPLFGQAIKEFEASARCKRLTLNHYMLKPVQRIPQYRLLLQEYLHHLPSDSVDYDDTTEALRIVSDVANHANESMRHGDNFQKMISIQSSIIGHREIIKPGRVFVKEGELMKLSRKGMQPRWFVLLNDLLLYLTPVQQGLYRINHELTLAGMKVTIPLQQDFQNEFSIISVTRSFTLNAKSPDERQEWITALTKAIEENATKRSTFTAGRLQQRTDLDAEEAFSQGFILGKTAPVWIPDARVTMCQLCTSEFTVTFRRHHCRACGKVVCSICSSNRISLPYLGNRIARVCDECYARLGQSSSGCNESGETDSDNQQVGAKSHPRTERHHKKPKRQLPSVLKEVCANDLGSTISGYIHKRINNSWKKNWFVIKEKVLYEFRASEDIAALRSIPLLGFQINTFSEPYEGVDPSLLFEISHPGQAPVVFHAETPGFAERWIKELKDATVLE